MSRRVNPYELIFMGRRRNGRNLKASCKGLVDVTREGSTLKF